MKIVIVGAGEVGSYLCSLLSEKGHDVTVIETKGSTASRVDEESNVRVIEGNGSSAETLHQANVASCDFFVALTSDDKTNLISSSLSKALGAKKTICRIHDQTYTDTSYLNYREHFGIDYLINPEGLCAVELAKRIRNPGRVAVENFARGQIEVQQVTVSERSKLIGKPLKELKKTDAKFGYIQRHNTTDVPTANTILEANDIATIFGTPDAVFNLRAKLDPSCTENIINVIVFGGGETARALIRLLTRRRFQIKVIEEKLEICRELSEKFPHITVIQGDGTSLRLMEEEQIGNTDYFVATTKDDENNIVTGLQASKLGVKHVQAVINKKDYDDVLDKLKNALGVELIVSPRIVTGNEVLRLISTDAYLELGKLPDKKGKILEIKVSSKSPVIGQQILDIPKPNHSLFAALQHRSQIKVPNANDRLEAGDRLVVICHEEDTEALVSLFNDA